MSRPCQLLLLALCLASVSNALRDKPFRLEQAIAQTTTEPFTGEVWALLIAGSSGYGNYRHQADVAHAYQVLHKQGVPDDHIVVMVCDDIASDMMNPHPGKLFNQPGGPDVYAGMPKDYTGENVNVDTFLSVLAGNEDAPAIVGTSGKTIKSGPNDRVFLYYSDHGAPGILGMPSGEFLYGDKLVDTLHNKSKAGGFSELVAYIEACESGSIFQGGMLDDGIKIYAVTAANAEESSWGAYCPGQEPEPPAEFTTCLGDLFSISFLEDDDTANLTTETLESQFELVKLRTSQNGTYMQGSHVMQFGSLTIDTEPVGDYVGEAGSDVVARAAAAYPARIGAVPQREADLLPLRLAVQRAPDPQAKATAEAKLQVELARRSEVNNRIRATAAGLLLQPSVAVLFQSKYGGLLGSHAAAAGTSEVELLVTGVLPRPPDAPLVDDWDCLRAMVAAWEGQFGRLDQYGMQYSRTFANLCNIGVPPSALREQAARTCSTVASS